MKRPVIKVLKGVDFSMGTSQVDTGLYEASVPGTVENVRYEFYGHGTGPVNTNTTIWWAVVVKPSGVTVSTMAPSGGQFTLYKPEEHVIAHGALTTSWSTDGVPTITKSEGKSYVRRRLQPGDQVRLLTISNQSATNGSAMQGVISFYIKT